MLGGNTYYVHWLGGHGVVRAHFLYMLVQCSKLPNCLRVRILLLYLLIIIVLINSIFLYLLSNQYG